MTETNQKKARPSRLEVFIILFSFIGMVVFELFSDPPFKQIFGNFFIIIFLAANLFSINRIYKLNKSSSSPPLPLGLAINACISIVVLFIVTDFFEISHRLQIILFSYVFISVNLVLFYFAFKSIFKTGSNE